MMGIMLCGGIYLYTVIQSLVLNYYSDGYSNGRIKKRFVEEGYELIPMNDNSFVNNFKYYLKVYGVSFIPLYNVIDALNKDANSFSEDKSDKIKYDNKRIKLLLDSGLLVKTKQEACLSKEEKIKVEKKIESKEEPIAKAETLNEMSCYERREFFKNEYEKSCRECELENLKTERDFLLSNTGDQMKLSRK